jgi:hypothetical protein
VTVFTTSPWESKSRVQASDTVRRVTLPKISLFPQDLPDINFKLSSIRIRPVGRDSVCMRVEK